MSTGIDCVVLIDGVRAADGSPGEAPDAPAIIEELSVTWGRSDTMSQPAPDSCSFSVVDPLGGDSFVSVFRTGARVDVLANGESFPDPSIPTFIDGDFETDAVTYMAVGGVATRSDARAYVGTYALHLAPESPGDSPALWLAPSAFQPAGTNPGAWDSIPTTKVGQEWAYTVSLWLPAGASAAIKPVLYTGPYETAGTPVGASNVVVGNGTWQTVSATFPVNVDHRWVGLLIVMNPTGPTWDQLPPALDWDGVDPSLAWDELGSMYVDDVQVTSPAEGAGRGVLVFSGRITDAAASWDESWNAPLVQITATGFTADLDNRVVGDEPWVVESVNTRAQRIIDLSGLPIDLNIDPTIASILVSWRDVDAQGATGLLTELAASVDGVLWPAVHQSLGAYLRMEDVALRAALLRFSDETGLITIVEANPDEGFDLTACVILRDPVTWVQDVSDISTRVSVGWKVQGLDDEGNPTTTDATEYLIDPALEITYGTRGVSISTELQAATDAQDVAGRVLSRANPSVWRATGLTVDDQDVTGDIEGISLMLGLLDGTSRIGAPIVIGDLPTWSPAGSTAGVYLEGGTYTNVGGRWVLELTVSAATGQGESAQWDSLDPDWTWDQWSPSLSWNDLRGVAAP